MTRRTMLGALLFVACGGTQVKNPPPGPEPAVQISAQAVLSTPKGLQAIPEGAVLHSGDRVAFHVQTSRELMFFVVQESTAHKLTMQIPRVKLSAVLARAKQETRIPPQGTWLHPESEPGEQALYLVASRVPVEESLVMRLIEKREVTREREPPPIIIDKQRGGEAATELVPPQVKTLGPDGFAIIPFRYYSE
jgi:hypothetical protein